MAGQHAAAVPEISRFLGIIIRMYWDEHAPPHFHAVYGNDEAVIGIDSLELVRGSLPRRAKALTLEWASVHRAELLENWDLCATKQRPNAIPPLE